MSRARIGVLPGGFHCDAIEQMHHGITFTGPRSKFVTWHLSDPCPAERCTDEGGVVYPMVAIIPRVADSEWTRSVNQELLNIMWCVNHEIPTRAIETTPCFVDGSGEGNKLSVILEAYRDNQFPFSTILQQQEFYQKFPNHQLGFELSDIEAWKNFAGAALSVHQLMMDQPGNYFGVEPVLTFQPEGVILEGYKLINGDVLGKTIPNDGKALQHLLVNGVFPCYNKAVAENPKARMELYQMLIEHL